jgi:hypothetical protein
MERRAILVPATMAVALVATCAVVLLMVPQEAEATFPGKPGKIAYSGFEGNDTEIYTIDPNGTGKFQVTKNGANDTDPAYSLSGRRVALSGFDGKDFEIYTIIVRGEKRVQVTKNGLKDAEPSYSPNAKKITYSGADAKYNDIYTINPDGGGKFQVTENATRDYAPSWGESPVAAPLSARRSSAAAENGAGRLTFLA